MYGLIILMEWGNIALNSCYRDFLFFYQNFHIPFVSVD